MPTTDYEALADLRGALTADNPDRRAEAYGAVVETGHDVSDVLSTPPKSDAIAALEDAQVIPSEEQTEAFPQAEYKHRVVSLLEDIEANTGGT